MYRFLFLLLLLCGSRISYAQIPGYLGKRTTVQVDGQITPALNNPTSNNKSFFGGHYFGNESGGKFGFNWRVGANAGYTLSRRHQLVLGAGYLKTGMIGYATSEYIDPFSGIIDYDIHDLFYNLTGKTVELGMRFFNPLKGAIAPFGRYHTWSLQATFIDGKIIDKRTSYAYSPEPRTTHGPLGIDTKVQHWEIAYEFGQNIIIKDLVVLNVAGRFHIPVRLDKVFSSESEGYVDNQTEYENEVFKRMSLHSLLTLKVGAGLIF